MNEDRVIQKLIELDEKMGHLTTKVDGLATNVDSLSIKVDDLATNESHIIQKVIELDEKVENMREVMATKDDVQALTYALDQQGVILQRLDQERIFMNVRINRIEEALVL